MSGAGSPFSSDALNRLIVEAATLQQQGHLAEAEARYQTVLRADPRNFNALHLLGVVRFQQGRAEDAVSLIQAAIRSNAKVVDAHNNLGMILRALGRTDEAIASLRRALELQPDHVHSTFNLAVAFVDADRYEEAIACCRRVLAANPEHADAYAVLGAALAALGNHADAVALYRRSLAIAPDNADSRRMLADSLSALGHAEDAIACYHHALALSPHYPEAHQNLGVVLGDLGRHADALASFRRALADRPDDPDLLYNVGNELCHLRRHEEALAVFGRLLEIRPGYAEGHYNLGCALEALHRGDDAAASYRRALAVCPHFVEAHQNLGNALRDLRRFDEAIASYRQALALDPERADLHYGLALILGLVERNEEAIRHYRRALELDPDHASALGELAYAERRICAWQSFAEREGQLAEHVRTRRSLIAPFGFLAFSDDPADQLRCARSWVENLAPGGAEPVATRPAAAGERIRLGYLSSDFHDHATAHLMAELFERHDRERFEVFAFSYGPDDASAMRRRLEGAFDRFVDVRSAGDRAVAQRIADEGIDIAVDLKGHTQDSRPRILAHRPAPIQVGYLGFPGTMGADFIDYILVDRFVVPGDQQPHFAERLVHLPDCYQVNDTRRPVAGRTPTRRECGLPDHGFVFCSFNNTYKITPAIFDVWMRLLAAVPGSVLWLLGTSAAAEGNLGREAEARGVAAGRLVFAPRQPMPEHLARQRLADLFLDTLPVGAHTTASDALWVGVPVLTCAGRTFASRVAGSLLHAIGLPELVTDSLAVYEAEALDLARDAAWMATLRDRLSRNRSTMPLFATDRFRRAIERAFTEMVSRRRRSEPPAAFAVGPSPE